MTNIVAWISTSTSDKQPSEFGGFEKHGDLSMYISNYYFGYKIFK